ncbi:ser/Thr protein phosphatase family protein [Westerdykella ornata]|uniref:Ser/Thr protein phosphatase family protein n=1 Tax=Westerdykella ornata TaxID=318751 RepID=A0A6A6JCG2_WESOR|nr:ser/Thr protein phosphatase family protein [Westerdykella ornata]KAF2273316.1 ser/Thr protein phosphatase family protein [Westerdykella ornata]
MSQTSTVKTRILIISDTHNAALAPSTNHDVAFREPLPKADVLLHCGDLTGLGFLEEHEQALDMLGRIDADLKLVIAGNHDISLDQKHYTRRGQDWHGFDDPDQTYAARAKELWQGEKAKAAGVTYLEEGTHCFVLKNGARLRVYASPYQPEFGDMAFQYADNQDRFNPKDQSTPDSQSIVENPVPDFPAVDVMMTHGPPLGILDDVGRAHAGCEHLLRAARRCKPKLHCFGHIHEGWGARRVKWKEGDNFYIPWKYHVERYESVKVDHERMKADRAAFVDISQDGEEALVWGRETLMVNASIMTVEYRPHQGPWIVDMDLDKATNNAQS